MKPLFLDDSSMSQTIKKGKKHEGNRYISEIKGTWGKHQPEPLKEIRLLDCVYRILLGYPKKVIKSVLTSVILVGIVIYLFFNPTAGDLCSGFSAFQIKYVHFFLPNNCPSVHFHPLIRYWLVALQGVLGLLPTATHSRSSWRNPSHSQASQDMYSFLQACASLGPLWPKNWPHWLHESPRVLDEVPERLCVPLTRSHFPADPLFAWKDMGVRWTGSNSRKLGQQTIFMPKTLITSVVQQLDR